jgi:hypothetical protein
VVLDFPRRSSGRNSTCSLDATGFDLIQQVIAPGYRAWRAMHLRGRDGMLVGGVRD